MNEDGFRSFLKNQKCSKGTITTCIKLSSEIAAYMVEHRQGTDIDDAVPEDIHAFIAWKKKQRKSVNSYLWALSRYYDFTGNTTLRKMTADLRQQEIAKKRSHHKSLKLKDIQGIDPHKITKLAEIRITDVSEMIKHGQTKEERTDLADKCGLQPEEILKLVKLTDLTRIVDIKGVRVRLLYEAGFDTIEKISKCDPEVFRQRLVTENKEKQILKRNPTLVEAKYWVAQARELDRLVKY